MRPPRLRPQSFWKTRMVLRQSGKPILKAHGAPPVASKRRALPRPSTSPGRCWRQPTVAALHRLRIFPELYRSWTAGSRAHQFAIFRTNSAVIPYNPHLACRRDASRTLLECRELATGVDPPPVLAGAREARISSRVKLARVVICAHSNRISARCRSIQRFFCLAQAVTELPARFASHFVKDSRL
jgi:hypothetical protein